MKYPEALRLVQAAVSKGLPEDDALELIYIYLETCGYSSEENALVRLNNFLKKYIKENK